MSVEETRAFLAALHGSAVDQGLHTLIWTSRDKASRFFTNLDDAAAYASQRAANSDVYTGMGVFRKPPPSGRGKAEAVDGISSLWADVDVAGPGHKKRNLPPTREAARGLLAEMPLEPSILLDTGGGLQAHWLLREVFTLDAPGDRERAEATERGWVNLLRSLAAKRGWDVDPVGDLARVMRVAGTQNLKVEGKPRPVRVVEPASPNGNLRRYNLPDFEAFTDEEPPPVKAKAVAPRAEVGPLILCADAEPPPPNWRRSWRMTNDSGKPGTARGLISRTSPHLPTT